MASKYILMLITLCAAIGTAKAQINTPSWRCAGKTVYDLTVLPDGTYRSAAENVTPFGFLAKLISVRQFRINYHKRYTGVDDGKFDDNDGFGWAENNFVYDQLLSFEDVTNAPISGFDDVISPYDQLLAVRRDKGVIERIDASVRSSYQLDRAMLLSIHKDGEFWRFALTNHDLTTEAQARELNIFMAGKPNTHTVSANATSFIFIGDCYKQN